MSCLVTTGHVQLDICYLSMWQVLTGCVSSCEDHGYVIDVGLKGTTAFLNSTEAEKYTSAYGEGVSHCTFQFLVVAMFYPVLYSCFIF